MSILTVIEQAHTRDDVVPAYADTIVVDRSYRETDWVGINEAIIDKWSVSGLFYIKDKAWKILDERRKQAREP